MDNTRLAHLQKFYDRLFTSGLSLSRLRDSTIAERLYPGPSASINILGRSLAWKLFLTKEEPLQASLPPRAQALLEDVRKSRQAYEHMLSDKMQPPDARSDAKGSIRVKHDNYLASRDNMEFNDPLSPNIENPWNDWFAGLELRKVILQDVERTFPDIPFFRDPEVQDQLTNILYLYSSSNPAIGYRQGMHEVLAPLYLATHHDAITESESEAVVPELAELCSFKHTAADSWALFVLIMKNVSRWYEWREPPITSTSPSGPQFLIIPEGQNGIQPYIAPIVQACNIIQSQLLKKCDPILWQSIQKAGIEPQIYGIRWLRLLFTREFTMQDSLTLWDSLFACDPSLDLAQWVCVAMLIRIRNELIPADYSEQLTTLLRYPSPPASNIEGSPHHTILLVRQALALQMSPTAATGSSITIENRTLLGIPIEVPESAPIPRRVRNLRPPTMSANANMGAPTMGRNHMRQLSSPAIGLTDVFNQARGLVERGESLGINKTLMNAVTEIRRNIPEFSLGARAASQPLASFPLEDERPIEERAPWEPKTRFEMEKELAETRLRDKSLGESLAWIVDALLLDDSDSSEPSRTNARKREALESLSYVRDALMTNIMNLDEDRLTGYEERARREEKLRRQAEELKAVNDSAVVAPPAPVPVADSHLKHQRTRSRPQSPPPAGPLGRTTTNSSFSTPGADISNTMPPWIHTPSGFSNPTAAVPTSAMPRPPPPTSTQLRRDRKKMTDQTPQKTTEIYQDPLGALR